MKVSKGIGMVFSSRKLVNWSIGWPVIWKSKLTYFPAKRGVGCRNYSVPPLGIVVDEVEICGHVGSDMIGGLSR